MQKIAIFGTGGFALEIADVCDSLAIRDMVFISHYSESIKNIHGFSVVEESEREVDELMREGYGFAIGVAEPLVRRFLYQKYENLEYPTLIHPAATFGINQEVTIRRSKGVIVAAGARIMSRVRIGNFVIIGLNSTIGHDCEVGDYVAIMPGANVSGNVILSDSCYIGSGAVVVQGEPNRKRLIGANVTVGAGAVVTKSFSSDLVLAGVPATVLKSKSSRRAN